MDQVELGIQPGRSGCCTTSGNGDTGLSLRTGSVSSVPVDRGFLPMSEETVIYFPSSDTKNLDASP